MNSSVINHHIKELDTQYPSNYTVLDFETTGLDPYSDQIIQIGAFKYRNFRHTDEFVTLVNPCVQLSERTITVTGITDNEVTKAPYIYELIGALKDFIGDDVIIAHYALFDIRFYITNLQRYSFSVKDITYVDTVSMAREFIKGVENYKLPTLKAYLNINAKSHLADQDCYACNEVYKYCVKIVRRTNK